MGGHLGRRGKRPIRAEAQTHPLDVRLGDIETEKKRKSCVCSAIRAIRRKTDQASSPLHLVGRRRKWEAANPAL